MLAYFICFLLNYVGLRALLSMKLTPEKIREDGPKSHAKKQGVMTMGGVLFVGVTLLVSLVFDMSSATALFCLTLGSFAVLGFYDDFVKLTVSQGRGLGMRIKLIIQFALGLLIADLMWRYHLAAPIAVPFTSISFLLPHYANDLFGALVMVSSVNAVNFTDGIDGLAVSQFMVVCACLLLLTLNINAIDASFFHAAEYLMIGCLVFWWFNFHPAKVFMGDVGSIALGAVLAYWFLLSGYSLYYPLIGVVFVLEVLSVIIQIASFKLRGKRVFRMAPFHHHLELCGWSNSQIVGLLMAVTASACCIAYMGIQ